MASAIKTEQDSMNRESLIHLYLHLSEIEAIGCLKEARAGEYEPEGTSSLLLGLDLVLSGLNKAWYRGFIHPNLDYEPTQEEFTAISSTIPNFDDSYLPASDLLPADDVGDNNDHGDKQTLTHLLGRLVEQFESFLKPWPQTSSQQQVRDFILQQTQLALATWHLRHRPIADVCVLTEMELRSVGRQVPRWLLLFPPRLGDPWTVPTVG